MHIAPTYMNLRDNAQKPQVLLRLNSLQVGCTLDDIKLESHWRLIYLMHANFKERLCRRIVCDKIIGTVIWLGYHSHDHQASLFAGLDEIVAVRYFTVDKIDIPAEEA